MVSIPCSLELVATQHGNSATAARTQTLQFGTNFCCVGRSFYLENMFFLTKQIFFGCCLTWLLMPKISQDEYTFMYILNQDSKEGKEILNSPNPSCSSASFPSGRARFAPGLSLWSLKWKTLSYKYKKYFSDFLSNVVGFVSGAFFVAFFFLFLFLMWPVLEVLYVWIQNLTNQR